MKKKFQKYILLFMAVCVLIMIPQEAYGQSNLVKSMLVPSAPASASARLRCISGGYDDVIFSWSKVEDASGYNVYYKKASDDKYKFYKSTTGTSVVKKDLTDGVKYIFKVIPYAERDDKTYSSSAHYRTATVTTLKQVKIQALTTKGTKVRVKWTNIGGETGYQISRSSKKNGTYIIEDVETVSGRRKQVSAAKNKKYYYKVRAYKTVTVNGETKRVYGPWSAAKPYKRTSSSSSGYSDILDYDSGNLFVLVNKEHAVSDTYHPSGMVAVKDSIATWTGLELKKSAYEAYLEMLEDAQKEGHDFYICSAYRSIEKQKELYETSLKKNGKKYTEKMTAYPGTSEHHTGYAVDVTSKSMGWGLKQNFTDYADGQWITDHCSEYGFIIRYPEGKTDITGYSYEPWHLRYVGKTAAKEITEKGITLEEYLGEA